MTNEEKLLGLDPEKYAKKSWNPQDYFGYSQGNPEVMQRIADEMRAKVQQESFLKPEEYVSPEERMKNQKQMLIKSMGGITPEQIKEIDRKFYALPEKQELIQRLAIEMKDGLPALGEADEKLFDETQRLNKSKWSDRQKMLYKLLSDEEM